MKILEIAANIEKGGACVLEVCVTKPSFDLEERLTRFLENLPTITKDWLHYKM
jgi:cobalamin-dependent methionine synthase I